MKLYTVHIEAAYMCLAESESDARSLASDYLAMEGITDDDCFVGTSGPSAALPDGWDEDCLVYGGTDETTVATARRISRP